MPELDDFAESLTKQDHCFFQGIVCRNLAGPKWVWASPGPASVEYSAQGRWRCLVLGDGTFFGQQMRWTAKLSGVRMKLRTVQQLPERAVRCLARLDREKPYGINSINNLPEWP